MLNLLGRHHGVALHRRATSAVLASCFLFLLATAVRAQDAPLPPVSIGAGVRTAFVHTAPAEGDSTDAFTLDSVRLYVSGSATKQIKFMFNTEYDSANHINVLDANAQFEISPTVNFWVGRFLPPSDRANMYGPYYASHWAVYQDGVQDGYPFVAGTGRDNGAMYWGQFGKVKLSGGGFDGLSATGNHKLITAGRAQIDFWDPEAGYYLNGTYYGGKNLLAIGVAGQVQSKESTDTSEGTRGAWNVDFLLEKKLPAGAITIESEYAKYAKLGGYNSHYNTDQGGYVLAAYLFPPMMGTMGKWQILGKFGQANFSNGLNPVDVDYSQKTSELNLNYLIKEFNARIMVFYLDKRFSAVQPNSKQFGVGIQLQM